MKKIIIKENETNNKLQETYNNIIDIVEEIPFGNSDFQNQNTIINGEKSPHRGMRAASLRIIDRIGALNETRNKIEKNNIEIERKERKIKKLELETPENYDLDIRELELDIYEIKSQENYTKKLVKDAIQEINSLLPFFNKIGKITREEFENLELQHFTNKFIEGASKKDEYVKGLENIGYISDENKKLVLTKNTLYNNITLGQDNTSLSDH